jgi:hypothetical protein
VISTGSASSAVAADGGSGTYSADGASYAFDLLNSGTTPWQYFSLVAPAGAIFTGGATVGEITARCLTGQPDGEPNEIECGPLSAAGLAPGVRVVFIGTLSVTPACGAPFQLAVSSTGVPPYTAADAATYAGSCTTGPPTVAAPPTVRGTPVVGDRLVVTPPRWSQSPTQVAYQWQLCTPAGCEPISGKTALALVLGAKDAGHTVRVVVSATFGTVTLISNSRKIAVRGGPRHGSRADSVRW